MKTTDIIRRAGRSLRQAKIRTILTSLAIGVGAFTLTLSLAAGAGARKYAHTLISSNVDANSLAVARDKDLFGSGTNSGPKEYDANSANFQGTTIKQLTEDDLTKISKLPGVASVTPTYNVTASYITREGQKKYTGSIDSYDPTVLTTTEAGSLPNDKDQIKDNEVVVPNSFLEALGFKNAQQAIGQTVTVHAERTSGLDPATVQSVIAEQGVAGLQELAQSQGKDYVFKIVAVSKKSAAALQSSNNFLISENGAKTISDFLTQDTAQYRQYTIARVQAKNGYTPDQVKATLAKAGYDAKTAKDLQNLLFTIVNVLQGIVGGFGVLALITSVFGIINTQYISVLERTQQIGLMKALGMRRRDVSRLFRFEAAWIGFLGGIIGSGVAYLIGSALNPTISEKLGIGKENHLLIFQALPIAGLLILLILIAIIAGALPARKAAKLDPVEALRTE